MAKQPRLDLDHVFSYHRPTAEDTLAYENIRAAAKGFAKVVLENTPACADQADALRSIRNATMTANAAVALNGRLNEVASTEEK